MHTTTLDRSRRPPRQSALDRNATSNKKVNALFSFVCFFAADIIPMNMEGFFVIKPLARPSFPATFFVRPSRRSVAFVFLKFWLHEHNTAMLLPLILKPGGAQLTLPFLPVGLVSLPPFASPEIHAVDRSLPLFLFPRPKRQQNSKQKTPPIKSNPSNPSLHSSLLPPPPQ